MRAFWLVLAVACVAWYGTITIYVAFRGFRDIRGMLQRLAAFRDAARRASASEPD